MSQNSHPNIVPPIRYPRSPLPSERFKIRSCIEYGHRLDILLSGAPNFPPYNAPSFRRSLTCSFVYLVFLNLPTRTASSSNTVERSSPPTTIYVRLQSFRHSKRFGIAEFAYLRGMDLCNRLTSSECGTRQDLQRRRRWQVTSCGTGDFAHGLGFRDYNHSNNPNKCI